jgi:hypothetical protein
LQVVESVPKCFADNIIISVGPLSTAVYFSVEKYNGSFNDGTANTDGAGVLTFALADIATDLDWFQPGTYVIRFMDASRSSVDFTDSSVTGSCFTFEITEDQAGTGDITWSYV